MNLKKRVNPTSSCAVNTENMADALYRAYHHQDQDTKLTMSALHCIATTIIYIGRLRDGIMKIIGQRTKTKNIDR